MCTYGCYIPWGWVCATGVPSFGGGGYTLLFHSMRMGVYLQVFHSGAGWGGGTYIYSSVWERGVPTGVPLLCDGCMYTHGCSTTEACVCIYSVTGVPLLRDGSVYTHGCSTAVGWVCTHGCSTAE